MKKAPLPGLRFNQVFVFQTITTIDIITWIKMLRADSSKTIRIPAPPIYAIIVVKKQVIVISNTTKDAL